jgi:hypothetical protein
VVVALEWLLVPLGRGLGPRREVMNPPDPWSPDAWALLLWHVFLVVVYTALGLGVFALAYLAIDKLTAFSFRKELVDDHNVAIGVMLGSVFIGIAIILAAAIRG